MNKEAPMIQDRQVRNDLFITETTELKIDQSMFHEMTKNKAYYPNKALTNQIGHFLGIEFSNSIKIEDVYGDVVINKDGSQIKKVVGIRCIKQGKRRNVDGNFMYSSPCVYDFIYADRAELAILSDAEKIGQTWPDGNPKCKYNFPEDPAKEARSQRKLLLDTKQFAPQRASTGSSLMVIREIGGMKTSFTPAEISVGKLMLSQIVQSKAHQEAIAAAKIKNIENGGSIADNNNSAIGQLTGTAGDTQGDFSKNFTRLDPKPDPEVIAPVITPEKKQEPVITKPLKGQKPGFSLRIQYETTVLESKLDQTWKDYIHTFVTTHKYSDIICQYAIAFLKTKVSQKMIQQLTEGVEQYHYHEATIKQAIPYFTGEIKV